MNSGACAIPSTATGISTPCADSRANVARRTSAFIPPMPNQYSPAAGLARPSDPTRRATCQSSYASSVGLGSAAANRSAGSSRSIRSK